MNRLLPATLAATVVAVAILFGRSEVHVGLEISPTRPP